ncbi:MAG: L-2-amino-thiazoline-4-carboxylic acid hydrolase [Clostridia bacterium]|nr:L-2-amino-thiazoline-4-carboxylic acid hydrolase [Clostridia bacterium]
MVKNEPHLKNPILRAIREQLDDDHFYLDFHYCPLVKAWQKVGATDEQISKLCSYAMCGDRGIISQFGGELDLQSTIADGSDICKIRFRRPNVDVEPKVKKVK